MNRYYEKESTFNSNSRIFKAYYQEADLCNRPRFGALRRGVKQLREMLQTVVSTRALRIVKSIVFSVLFLGFLGVAGAIEQGSLGIGTGLLLSAILLVAEYFLLRAHRA